MSYSGECLSLGDYAANVTARQRVCIAATLTVTGDPVWPGMHVRLSASPVTRLPVNNCP